MMAFEPTDAVILRTDIAGIKRVGECVRDTLTGDFAFLVAREVREAIKEALDFRLGLESAYGIALKGLPDD
nr:hypothetical protein [Leisingera aquaemixtae]